VGVSSAIRETASHLERRLQITLARLFHDYLQDMKRNNLKEDLRHVDRKLSESIAHSGRRIRSRDVSEDLYLLAYQAAARGHKFPIIQIGNTWVPGLEFHFDGDPWKLESRAAVKRSAEPWADKRFKVKTASFDDIPSLLVRPLSFFFGARSVGSKSAPRASVSPNVAVHSREHGWQVIYSPVYLTRRNGLGRSTPARGFVPPGRFRFGIAKPGRVLWDDTEWDIPTSSRIFLPLPPHDSQ
jgi:hypothetical protein